MKVLFEDNHLLVVEKPPGALTQGDRTGDVTLYEDAKTYIKEKFKKPGAVYLGLVHRLDRPTGGVLLFCRTSKAASRVSEQIRKREVEKTYLALCSGRPKNLEQTLRHHLRFDEKKRKAIVSDRGDEAVLKYKVINTQQNRSLLELKLITGRKHQIRAQMAHLGHPLEGDVKYGPGKGDGRIVPAIGLWAHKLKLIHPVKKEPLEIVSIPSHREYRMWIPFAEVLSSFEGRGEK